MKDTRKVKTIKFADTKKDVIRKHNNLTEAKYRITVQEGRVLAWLMSEIYKNDQDITIFRVSVSELTKLAGLKNKNAYQQMKEVTERLNQRLIKIKDIENNKELQSTFVASAEYEDASGMVEIEISQKLKPYLLNLEGGRITYTGLAYTLALKSSYSIRIYGLLAQYRVAGHRTIELQTLKEMFGIERFKAYERFDVLDSKVLKVAYKEINKKTDIRYEYEKIKRGRSIVAIKFIIKKNAFTINKFPSPKNNSSEIDKLSFYGVSKARASELVDLDIIKVQEALKSLKHQTKEIKNPAGWLVQYIEQGWNDSGKSLIENKKKQQQSENKRELEKHRSDQSESQNFKAYNRYIGNEILALIKKWSREKEAKNWEVLKEQKWRSKKSSIFHKQGIEKWTTILNRDIVLDYLKIFNDFKPLTQAQFEAKK